MHERARQFFLLYERANSCGDLSEIGSLYADTFLFGGPQGVQAVRKEDFLKIVPKMKSQFSSMGLVETNLHSLETNPINTKYLLVKVRWIVRLQTSSQMKSLDAFATYVLAEANDGVLSIVFQIDHQNLASSIRQLQDSGQ